MNASRPPNEDVGPRFLGRLARFVAFLRRQGLAVGVGAEVNLGRGLQQVGILDRASFREVCRATLAKSPAELALLENALEVFWSSGFGVSESNPSEPEPQPPRNPPADGLPSDRAVPLSLGRGYESPRPLPVGV